MVKKRSFNKMEIGLYAVININFFLSVVWLKFFPAIIDIPLTIEVLLLLSIAGKKGYLYVSEKYSHNLFTRANQHETDFASLYFRNNHMLYSALFGNMSD